MKKFAFIFGIVLIASILIAAGFWLGSVQHFMDLAYSVTTLDRTLGDASVKALVLHDLDSGKIDDARGLLRSELDSDIITIDAIDDYSDARNRQMATNLLARIAVYRAQYPAFYTNRMTDIEGQIDARITSILEHAKNPQTK